MSPGVNYMQIKEYEYLINKILGKVPNYLRDDCYQAACVGLLKADKVRDSVKFFKSYAYRCMQSEVIKEVAKLHGPGYGLYSLSGAMFLSFCEYKRRKNSGASIDDMKLSKGTVNVFEKMINSNRYQFKDNPFLKDEWDE